MESEVVTVTINPDGTAREVNPKGKKPREILAPENWAGFDDDEIMEARNEYEINQNEIKDWMQAEATLRTFEIEPTPCTCKTPREVAYCTKEQCDLTISQAKGLKHVQYTALVLETYTEPREGGISGKVKILS